MHLKDLKRRITGVLAEFKGEKMGLIGIGLILFITIIAIFAPVLAPNTNGQWDDIERWRDLPSGAAPVWADFLNSESMAPQKVKNNPYTTIFDVYTQISYEYDYTYDEPPKGIVAYVKGTYQGESPQIIVEIVRPDNRSLQIASEDIRGQKENGVYHFSHRISLLRRQDSIKKIYKFAKPFEGGDVVPQSSMLPASTLFAKAQDGMINNPESLKGKYKLNLLVVGDNIEYEKSRAIFKGRVYGLMGTDGSGHDIMRGWIWGARYALMIGLAVAGLAVVIALFFAMTSAYHGGWVDAVMQRINEIVMGMPILPILIIISLVWMRSIFVIILILGLFYWRGIAKTIRARGLQIRQNTYVEASEALGASGGRIIRTHMIPQMLPYAFAEAALMVPLAIITAAGLNVLGLGDPNIVTWGAMLSQAHSAGATIRGMWWWVLLPGIGITMLGFGFISAGMAVERIVNPKMKQE